MTVRFSWSVTTRAFSPISVWIDDWTLQANDERPVRDYRATHFNLCGPSPSSLFPRSGLLNQPRYRFRVGHHHHMRGSLDHDRLPGVRSGGHEFGHLRRDVLVLVAVDEPRRYVLPC